MNDVWDYPQEVTCSAEDRPRIFPKNIISGHSIKQSINAKMWSKSGENTYFTCEQAVKELPAGMYTCVHSDYGGYGFSAVPKISDQLLVLPDTAGETIIKDLKHFWTRQEHFREYGFLWKRGVLLHGVPGSGKCLGKGTPVIMYDGTIKNVEDIVVGDVLMGDDSTPRNVLSLARGREQMFKVEQKSGNDYICNKSHILSIVRSSWKKGNYSPHRRTTEYRDVPLMDFYNASEGFKGHWFGYKTAVDFPKKDVPIDPYYLGVWLGDGTSSNQEITTADPEIVEFLQQYASSNNLFLVARENKTSGKATTYNIAQTPGKRSQKDNVIRVGLKKLQLFNNKHIPQIYKSNSREIRLQLLAGLLDSDGYQHNKGFEFSNTNKQLVIDFVFLARSLGFRATVCNKTSYNKKTGFNGISQSVHVSGPTHLIPTKVARKQADVRTQIKNCLHTSINIIPLEEDNYYGFVLDGNHRFLLGDFTVTHNSSLVTQICDYVHKELDGLTIQAFNPALTATCLSTLRLLEPTRLIVVILEDVDDILYHHGEANMLSLMDGETQLDNIVYIATTNYPEKLDKRFINRPSRFDVIKKIDLPTYNARRMFFSVKVPTLTDEQLDLWSASTDKFSIAHMKEVIVSVCCLGNDFNETIARLRKMTTQKLSSDEFGSSGFGFTG